MNTWQSAFSDDSYFNWNDSSSDESPTFFYCTEIFNFPVIYRIEAIPKESRNTLHNENDQHILLEILEKNPFDELNSYDREILWRNRHQVIGMPKVEF